MVIMVRRVVTDLEKGKKKDKSNVTSPPGYPVSANTISDSMESSNEHTTRRLLLINASVAGIKDDREGSMQAGREVNRAIGIKVKE